MIVIYPYYKWVNKMSIRSFNNYYKTCDIEKMSPLDKKRYELLNEYGYNIDCNKRKIIDTDDNIIKHKNSMSK